MSDMYQCFGDGPFIYRLNDNGNGPTLLSQVCIERGWREYTPENGDNWNLWWRTSGFPFSQYKEIKYSQFTNHIPKGASICRKDNLARHLKRMRKVYGSIYDFSPHCYNIPLEYTKLAAECTRSLRNMRMKSAVSNNNNDNENENHHQRPDENDRITWRTLALNRIQERQYFKSQRYFEEAPVWICKPVAQSQGRGIFLFRKLSDLTYETNSVVQRYIEKPLLIGGYKFDLRLYVCVPSYHPLTIYLYREGLVRFGTDKFTLSDLNNPFRHLTNSSINKMGPGYSEVKERIGSGCKWTIRQLRRYFQHAGMMDWLLWQRIACLIVLTILSHAPLIPQTVNCFEFFGFDVLLDSEMRPWLLEVNLSPALGNDCQADEEVKRPLLHDLFDLMGLPLYNTGLALYTIQRNIHSDDEKDEPLHHTKTRKSVLNAAGRWKKHRKGSSGRGKSSKSKSSSNKSSHSNIYQSYYSNQIVLPTKPRLWETITSGNNVNASWFQTRKGVWGNGRDWKESPISEGGWTRLFPYIDDGDNMIRDDGSVKKMVSQVQKFKKTAFEIAKSFSCENDEELSERLIKMLNLSTDIWVPYD